MLYLAFDTHLICMDKILKNQFNVTIPHQSQIPYFYIAHTFSVC